MLHRLTAGQPVRSLLVALSVVPLIAGIGCRQTPTFESASLPARHSIKSEKLLLLSDFRVAKDHPLLSDLERLRELVINTLELPPQRDEVVVYLFDNQEHYRQYLNVTFPGLPERRAYFVGTSSELMVYTYWGSRVMEDLRHEYTHGILHSSLTAVPLWLDEGLAEYFEVGGDNPGGINGDHASRLTVALSNGWRPDLKRLESLTDFAQMQKIDYQEAWVWSHYLIHTSPETRQVLVDYLADLRNSRTSRPISERLSDLKIDYESRFVAHLASLQTQRVLSAHSNLHQPEPVEPTGVARNHD